MMRPIENLCLNQWSRQRLRNSLAWRVYVFAEIGMVNEASAADFQFRSEFSQVRFHDFPIRVNERIEAENEIDGTGGNHRQRAAVIEVAVHMRINRESVAARFNAFTRFINSPQLLAIIFQIMRPPPETGRNFQNRARWQKLANSRKNCALPLCSGTAPGL